MGKANRVCYLKYIIYIYNASTVFAENVIHRQTIHTSGCAVHDWLYCKLHLHHVANLTLNKLQEFFSSSFSIST